MKFCKLFIPIITSLLTSCAGNLSSLETHNQTIELQYITWACECANWAKLSDIEKYADNPGDKLADLSIFIEPEDPEKALPDSIGYNGDIVLFTGKFYTYKGYPKGFTPEEGAEKARVFRYSKYRIISSSYREVKQH